MLACGGDVARIYIQVVFIKSYSDADIDRICAYVRGTDFVELNCHQVLITGQDQEYKTSDRIHLTETPSLRMGLRT